MCSSDLALPTTRVAVMGPAGVDYVYKDELRAIRGSVNERVSQAVADGITDGLSEAEARERAASVVGQWIKGQEALLAQRYEQELMNPNEGLSLGSISQIVMPSDLRQVIAENMAIHVKNYEPTPLTSIQREFH